MRLTEDERVGIVGAMQERRQKLIDETNRMSVRSEIRLSYALNANANHELMWQFAHYESDFFIRVGKN